MELVSGAFFKRLSFVVTICHNSKLLHIREGALAPYKESEEYERFASAKAGSLAGMKSNESYISRCGVTCTIP